MEFIGLAVWMRCEVDDAGPVGVAGELAIEIGPALCFDLAFERAADLLIGPDAELLGDQVARAIAHAFLDVVPRDDKIFAVVAHAAEDQVDVRMFGIPVRDADPVEPGPEILLHLADELASKAFEVGHLDGVVGRDDEAEMMAVLLAPCREGLGIGVVDFGAEQPGLLSIPGDAFAAQIAQVGGERRASSRVAHDARLDHGAARPGGDEAIGLDRGALAAAEARAMAGSDRALA
ncbi:hypothetical protein MAUB1S_10412 [Mycolicibacterium aubagnense]